MPISAPNFSVQQISPASLLAGRRQQESNSIESIVNQFITFGLRERLNERQLEALQERNEASQQATSERTFMQDVNERRVIPVPEEGFDFQTAEGEAIDIPTFQGPPDSRFSDQEFVAAQDVLEARQQVAMSQPAGEGYFEGTTYGDLVSPTGGSISERSRLEMRQGDKDRVISRYQEFADEVEAISPNLASAVRSEIETIQEDPRFTEAEEQEFLDRAPLSRLADFNSLGRNIAEMEAERREEINGYVEHAARNLGLPTADGRTTRPLRDDERWAYALWRSGNLDMAENPEAARANLERILPQMRALPTAPAIQEDLTNWYTQSQRAESDAHLDFVDWIQGNTLNDDTSVRNEALYNEIRNSVGEPNRENISEWATRPESARFRGAFALFNNGRTSKARIYELARTGLTMPHGLEGERGINSAFRMLYGEEWDTFETPAGSVPAPRGLTEDVGAAESGQNLSIDVGGETISPDQGVQMLSGIFRNMAQTGGEDARRTLATVAMNAQGSQEDLVSSLRETANTYQRYAQEDETTEEAAETYRLYSNWFGALANRADRGYGEYRTVLEDIFYPALDESGAVEDMMDLSAFQE